VAVKIKLMRLGKIRAPHYRIVVADARTRRNGRAIETIGKYHPKEEPSLIEVDSERAQYWLSVGAQATEPVESLLKITGDWQKFKGLPGSEGTLRVKEVGASKLELFQAALAQAGDEPSGAATTPKKKMAKKADEAPAAKADDASAAKPDEAPAAKADEAPAAKADEAPAATDTAAPAGADAK
jgi:small subunit ribosomal protein S16